MGQGVKCSWLSEILVGTQINESRSYTSQRSSKHFPCLLLSKGWSKSQFRSPMHIRFWPCNDASSSSFAKSFLNELLSTEGGLYAQTRAIWRCPIRRSRSDSIDLQTTFMGGGGCNFIVYVDGDTPTTIPSISAKKCISLHLKLRVRKITVSLCFLDRQYVKSHTVLPFLDFNKFIW